ncbi:hypothetical protein NMY22_g4433 [Coprinellus aureogranulatus]|nr:hypothetical protein NMY22_g4433 [Coprinellus aureogranulatus]
MPNMSTLSNIDVQRKLDVHIHRLEVELSELKQKRNALSPISQLPAEIFCKIFVFSIPDLDYKDPGGRIRTHAMQVSHVSQTWRAIAVACPELWGDLHIGVRTTEKALTLALTRAQNAPISINMCGFDRDKRPSVPSAPVISALSRLIREEPLRFRELALYIREDSMRSLFEGFSGSFDNVTSLKLDMSADAGYDADLPNYLHSAFPQLRRIKVTRPRILPEQLLQWPNITNVSIHYLYATDTTIFDLFTFLKQFNGLRSFRIHTIRGLDLFEAPTTNYDKPFNLPNLEMFACDFDTHECMDVLLYLLSHATVPKTCRLHIDCCESAIFDRTRDISHLLSAAKSAYGHLTPSALRISSSSVEAWENSPGNPHQLIDEFDVKRRLIFVHEYRGYTMLSAQMWGWSFGDLRALDAEGEMYLGLTAEFWRFFANSAPALEVIRISALCGSAAAIGDFMKCLRGDNGSTGAPMVNWPCLKRLYSTLPTERRFGRTPVDDSALLSDQLEYALNLVDALKGRERAGSGAKPLELLAFTTPFFKPLDGETSRTMHGGAQEVTWKAKDS